MIMSYKLETVAKENVVEIINVISDEEPLKNRISFLVDQKRFPNEFSVDKENDSFCINISEISRPEDDDLRFLFFYKSQLYKLLIPMLGGDIDEIAKKNGLFESGLKKSVFESLAVFGCYSENKWMSRFDFFMIKNGELLR